MTDRIDLMLRGMLLDLAQNPDRESAERALPSILGARFGYLDASIREESKQRHLLALEAAAQQASSTRLGWLRALLGGNRYTGTSGAGWTLKQTIPILAIVGVAALAGLILLNWPHATKRTDTVRRPPPGRSGTPNPPDLKNESPRESPLVKIEKGRLGNSESDPSRQERKVPDDLVAQRVQVGTFAAVVGEPKWRLDQDHVSHPASVNGALYAGATLETGDADRLQIRFADGTILALDFNTVVKIPAGTVENVRPSLVKVEQGRVAAHVIRDRNAPQFALDTPVARAEVLGTRFGLALIRDSRAGTAAMRAELQVRSGKVRFINRHGSVLAGDLTESFATSDSAPSEPKRLRNLRQFWIAGQRTELVTSEKHRESHARWDMVYPWALHGLEAIDAEGGGAFIRRVETGLPGDKAGLQVGDVVISVDGRPVKDRTELLRTIFRNPHRDFKLLIRRGSSTLPLTLTTVRRLTPLPAILPRIKQALEHWTWEAMTGDWNRAVAALKDLAEKQQSAPAFNNLAVAYQIQDRLGPAIRNFKRAVELDPGCAFYRLKLGHALRDIGNFPRAIEEHRKAFALSPGWDAANWQLANLLSESGKSEEALQVLDAYLAQHPNSAVTWDHRGLVMIRLGWRVEARAALLRAVELEPSLATAWKNLADLYEDLREFDQAENAARKLVYLAPHSANSHYTLGRILFQKSSLIEGKKSVLQAIRIDRDFVLAYLPLTTVLAAEGRLNEAETAARTAIRLAPTLLDARMALAMVLIRQGKRDEAIRELETAIEIDPARPDLYYRLGNFYLEAKDFSKAEKVLKEYLRAQPNDGFALNNLALVVRDQGRFDEAVHLFRRAIVLGPNILQPHYNLTNLLRGLNRMEEAKEVALRTLVILPKDGSVHADFAVILDEIGLNRESESLFAEAMRIRPRDPSVYMSRGSALAKRSEWLAAAESFRAAYDLNPNHPYALQNLAVSYSTADKLPEAEQAFRKILASGTKEVSHRLSLADVLERQGKVIEAEETYRAALTLEPENPACLNGLARHLAIRKVNLDEAKALALKAVELAPKQAIFHDLLGWVHSQRGEFEDAEKWFRKSIELEPEFVRAWMHLGKVLEAKQRTEEAKASYRKALTLEPGNREAEEALRRIGGQSEGPS